MCVSGAAGKIRSKPSADVIPTAHITMESTFLGFCHYLSILHIRWHFPGSPILVRPLLVYPCKDLNEKPTRMNAVQKIAGLG